jgi:hypothetical protein
MLVREFFGVAVTGNHRLELELPLAVELDEARRVELSRLEDDSLRLVIERRIDPLQLTLETKTRHYEPVAGGGRRELPALRVPGNANIDAIDFTATLTFLTDVPLGVNRPFGGAELVTENDEDAAALEALGTRRVHGDMTLRPSTRTFHGSVDADAVKALMPKTTGLRLYADAVALNADVAKYREFWRVLESAFGLQDDALVAALAAYPPAQELGFGEDELRELLILRGRASHARTRGGLDELLRVGEQVSDRVERLKCLAERVILTKRTWGIRGSGVEELAPLIGWVGPDGEAVIHQRLVGDGAD